MGMVAWSYLGGCSLLGRFGMFNLALLVWCYLLSKYSFIFSPAGVLVGRRWKVLPERVYSSLAVLVASCSTVVSACSKFG